MASIVDANGIPVLAGAAAHMLPTPVVGRARARITRKLHLPPDHVGSVGRAWKCNLEVIRRERKKGLPPDAVVTHWIIEAPWSHEIVHSYSLLAVHLRSLPGVTPPTLYMEGATHEVALWAINPMIDRGDMLRYSIGRGVWLLPAIFAAHIVAASDEAAITRIGKAVELVCGGRISPHPSHAVSWGELFGFNMLRRAIAPEEKDTEE